MELIIGKKFKLEVWEKALKTMWLNEVAKFSVIKELLYDYPMVSKQLREYFKSNTKQKCCDNKDQHDHKHKEEEKQRHHCCGFNVLEHGIGHSDLDVLLKNPKDLDFIFELVQVEQPGEYTKESWALSDDERIKLIPKLKEEGNELFKNKKYAEASKKYEEAIGYLEQFMLREKPNDIEWNELNEQKLPILLNYSLCKFNLNDFYSCIEHCDKVLEFQPFNVKALFRRAKAHAAVWNVKEAKNDFELCRQLDSTLIKDVEIQLNHLNQRLLQREKEEREKFQGRLFS
jgi:AH receptor-interacting protein